MADKSDISAHAGKQSGVYYGKPENRRNPKALQAARPDRPPPANKIKGSGPPALIPKGGQGLHNNLPPPKRDEIVEKKTSLETSAFQKNQVTQEVNINVTFTPSLSSFHELVAMTYRELMIDSPNLTKEWTYEMFSYYNVSLLWLRITSLKSQFQQEMTQQELNLQAKYEGIPFSIPEPIRLYLNALGKIKTVAGQTLYPSFPPLPVTVLQGSQSTEF